jgi:hypothetical protein
MQAGQAAEEPDQVRLGSIEAPRCRRFTILDGMIVVLGVALWLVQIRGWMRDSAYEQIRLQPPVTSNRSIADFAVSFFALSIKYLVVTLTLTYMILRLRRPRPPVWDLCWQPGMLTSLIVLSYHLVLSLCFLVSHVIHSILYLTLNPLFGDRSEFHYLPGFLVACGWGAAKLMGQFRPEPGWIEWLGRALGLGWMTAGILLYFVI